MKAPDRRHARAKEMMSPRASRRDRASMKRAHLAAAEELQTESELAAKLLRRRVRQSRPEWAQLQVLARLACRRLQPRLAYADDRDRRDDHGGVCVSGRPGRRRHRLVWLARRLPVSRQRCRRVLRAARSRPNQIVLARNLALRNSIDRRTILQSRRPQRSPTSMSPERPVRKPRWDPLKSALARRGAPGTLRLSFSTPRGESVARRLCTTRRLARDCRRALARQPARTPPWRRACANRERRAARSDQRSFWLCGCVLGLAANYPRIIIVAARRAMW